MNTFLEKNKATFAKDFLASIVVFLVALPLCLGIAIASGVPPIYGLLSGIIGGIVVGSFTGSPLQVSGPAAGLAVMVFEIVNNTGLSSLGLICILAGLFQVLGYFLKLGNYFKAVSPAVVTGMLSGIGVLILASQLHVMLDHAPRANSIENIATIFQAFVDIFDTSQGIKHTYAATIGLICLVVLVAWNGIQKKIKLPIPAPLLAIIATTLVAQLSGLNINYIEIPENLLAGVNFDFGKMFESLSWPVVISGLSIALVATTETLLSVSAVDAMAEDHKSDYNKELLAQGMGNTVAGLIGAMPLTGVIVRSSANVEFGGKTRLSTIMHGIWIVLFLFLFSNVLELIPRSALAAILVYIGYKLIDVKITKKFFEFEKFEAFIYLATIVAIVTINLLYGVLIGYVLSLVHILYRLNHFETEYSESEGKVEIKGKGVMTFLSLPNFSKKVDDSIEKNKGKIILDLSGVRYMDRAAKEYVATLKAMDAEKLTLLV